RGEVVALPQPQLTQGETTMSMRMAQCVPIASRWRTVIAAVSVAVLAITVWVSPPLRAQEAGALQEVVVTATKREQAIQDVGIAMDAFGGVQLEDLNIHNSVDVANVTPGVFVGGSIGGQTSLFTIRGVTQNDFTDSVESPVAVYVDEAYIAMAQGQNFGLFDLD